MAQFHFQSGKQLPDAIVQIARKFAPFFVLHLKNPPAQAANNLFRILALAQLNHQAHEIQNREEQHYYKGNGKDQFLRGVGFLRNNRSQPAHFLFFGAQSLQVRQRLPRQVFAGSGKLLLQLDAAAFVLHCGGRTQKSDLLQNIIL